MLILQQQTGGGTAAPYIHSGQAAEVLSELSAACRCIVDRENYMLITKLCRRMYNEVNGIDIILLVIFIAIFLPI